MRTVSRGGPPVGVGFGVGEVGAGLAGVGLGGATGVGLTDPGECGCGRVSTKTLITPAATRRAASVSARRLVKKPVSPPRKDRAAKVESENAVEVGEGGEFGTRGDMEVRLQPM